MTDPGILVVVGLGAPSSTSAAGSADFTLV